MTSDIHRPELHVTAETGVLNAPAGVLNDRGTWHMLYQFQPKPGGPARWGHVIGPDGPFDWIDCDDVLAPEGEETTLRAGSVVAEGDGIGVYFTSGVRASSSIHLASATSIPRTCEVSDEASSIDPFLIRQGQVVGDQDEAHDFRSPAVVPGWERENDREAGHAGWLMLAVTGETAAPVPVILSSADGRAWSYEGPLTFEGDTGLESVHAMTAPRIMRLRDEVDDLIYDVLLVTLERDGIDYSGYLVGQLTGTVFAVARGFTRIDYGHDFVRPRSAQFTPGTLPEGDRNREAIVFGLLNGIGRQDDPTQHRTLQESKWANALSLPRVVTLQGGILYQTPMPGLVDSVASSRRAHSWTGLCEIPQGATITVSLTDGTGGEAARIIHSGDTLTLERSMTGQPHTSAPAVAPLREADSDSLTIVIDGSTVEVFADGGQVAMASRVYFEDGFAGLDVTVEGDAEILRSWEQTGNGR